MKVGIGLPVTVAGETGRSLLEWARRADAGPFSSLGAIDRLAYASFEPLVTLAAAAAVTARVRLMTTVLVAPLHNPGVLVEQVATIDAISSGRLILGVGVGGREDDFRVAPASFAGRGRRLDDQLERLRRRWPPGEGPELLVGGSSPAALARVGRWADGYVAGFGSAEQASRGHARAEASWYAAGRSGRPRFVGGLYFGLGRGAADGARLHLLRFYAYRGAHAEAAAVHALTSPHAVREAIRTRTDIGMDELVLWPALAGTDQVERLAALVG